MLLPALSVQPLWYHHSSIDLFDSLLSAWEVVRARVLLEQGVVERVELRAVQLSDLRRQLGLEEVDDLTDRFRERRCSIDKSCLCGLQEEAREVVVLEESCAVEDSLSEIASVKASKRISAFS